MATVPTLAQRTGKGGAPAVFMVRRATLRGQRAREGWGPRAGRDLSVKEPSPGLSGVGEFHGSLVEHLFVALRTEITSLAFYRRTSPIANPSTTQNDRKGDG